jgi:hypothetical protein
MTAVDTIITEARTNTSTNVDQVSAANALIFLNRVYHDLVNALQDIDELFFYQSWVADAVADQTNGEYKFQADSATVQGLKKLLKMEVKTHQNNTYYDVAREVSIRQLDLDWDYYLTNQSLNDPIYYIGEDGFFLAPQFTTEATGDPGNNQIRIYGVPSAIDLVAGGAETLVLVDRAYHWLLSLGMEYWIYKSLRKRDDSIAARQEYELEKNKFLSEMSNRDKSVHLASLPDDTDLE